MGKGFDYVKDLVVNFKLDWCCWVIPVRIGLFITGYFNIILAVSQFLFFLFVIVFVEWLQITTAPLPVGIVSKSRLCYTFTVDWVAFNSTPTKFRNYGKPHYV